MSLDLATSDSDTNTIKEAISVIVCRDCGKRNLAQEYCEKCGSNLYAKHRRTERRVRILDGSLVLK